MLCDCHIHMVLDGRDWRSAIALHAVHPNEAVIRRRLRRYRDLGFHWLRDGGDRWGVGAAAKKISREYGIVYRTPLAPLCMKGHYGGFIGHACEDLCEYAACVNSMKRTGADFVKIMISGLMDFDRMGVLTETGLNADTIHEMIRIAHEEGFSVMAHCNGASAAIAAADAGADSIEHGAYLNREALCAMKEAGTVWVPTLSTIGNLRGTGRFRESAVQQILRSAQENLAEFSRMGGLIAPGTDAGAWGVPHGCLSEIPLLEHCLGPDTSDILEKGIGVLMQKF